MGLTSNTYISRWQKCYPIDSELLSLSSEPISQGQMKNDPKSREQILEEENLRLKKALETEKLRSRAFQQLIELTEKEEGISILKKMVPGSDRPSQRVSPHQRENSLRTVWHDSPGLLQKKEDACFTQTDTRHHAFLCPILPFQGPRNRWSEAL